MDIGESVRAFAHLHGLSLNRPLVHRFLLCRSASHAHTRMVRRCRFCAEGIPDAAIVCPHCGRELIPGRTTAATAPIAAAPPVFTRTKAPLAVILFLFGVPRAVQWGFHLAGNPISFEARIGLTLICAVLVALFWGSGWTSTPPETP